MHSEHGDGHIGNTLSMSASAYQGNAFIHLPRRPLRALGCGPEAMVLVEQNNSSSLPIWLDTKHSTLQVLYLTSTPAQSEGLACSLGLHIGSQTLLWQNCICQSRFQSFQNLRVLAMQCSSSAPGSYQVEAALLLCQRCKHISLR